MANVKITALTNLGSADVDAADVFVIDDVSASETKKVTVANLQAAIDTIATSNINTVSANADAYYAQLNANINVVQDNVATLSTVLRVAGDSGADDVTVGTDDLTFTGDSNVSTAVTDNTVTISVDFAATQTNIDAVETRRADNVSIRIDAFTGTNAAIVATESRVNSNLDVTNDNVSSLTTTVDNFGTYANTNLDTKANVSATYFLALANDFATYSLINANLDIVQDNVATLTTTVDNFGTSSNANAAALALEDAALQTRLGANVTTLLNADTALQARITANALVAASNDYVTYTRLDANVSAVQDNVAAAEANIASIIDGSTSFTGDVTMNQALTVSGNLYVIGAQVDLGISSAQIDDATLLLAANTPADAQLGVDSGIVINRGQDANVFFGFASYGDHIDFIFTDAPADNAAHYAIAYIDVHANSFGAEGTHDPTFTAVHHADRPTTGFYFPTNEIVGVIGGAYKANITASGLEAVAVYSDGVELQANDSATLFSAYANDYATHTQISANVDVVQDNIATLTTTVDNFGTSSNANAAALAAGIVGITPIGTSDISDNAVTVDKLAATLDLGALS